MPADKYALISVSDKTGLQDLVAGLAKQGFKLLSTGGTAAYIKEHKVEVEEVSAYTGEEEILGGRVKTLHPKVFAGILADRSDEAHMKTLEDKNIAPIDLVVVNFYPFNEAVEPKLEIADAINKIDVGGPSMVRAAAKNHEHVVALVDPSDYGEFLDKLAANGGEIPSDYSRRLAKKAFALISVYDAMIADYFSKDVGEKFPSRLSLDIPMQMSDTLRYGENPHQEAAIYFPAGKPSPIRQEAGSGMSYNNFLDLDAAWKFARSVRKECCAAIFKHGNPSGASARKSPAEAIRLAREADPQSAFGGVIACTREIDEEAARVVSEGFYELICAPKFSPQAIEIMSKRKSLRILTVSEEGMRDLQFRSIAGGMIAQEIDAGEVELEGGDELSPEQWNDVGFAWKVAKHTKSNAIVLVRDLQTVGIGAGQMSRVGSAKLACEAAKKAGKAEGAVAASDGFLPFPDTLEVLAEAGVVALVQPGGSKSDDDVAKVADSLGVTMLPTGMRHFLH